MPSDSEKSERSVPFRVLGPLEVLDGAVAVTAQRQRLVLATLLLNANRVVSLERLIRAVWGGSPPATARAQVQSTMSALRRSLSAGGVEGCIRTGSRGYQIEVRPGQLDLHVFADLVARGRAAATPDAARAAYREALGLWRGEPLADLDSAVLQAAALRLAEQRIEALEECIDTELALGLHHRVIGEVQELCAEHPFRERLATQLITALYRAGRQAEALAAYRRIRQRHVEELGLEPGLSLSRLERAILTGDDSHDLSPAAPAAPAAPGVPVPRTLPAPVADFVGREPAFEAIRRRLADAPESAAPEPVVVVGRAGVGKSALVSQVAGSVAAYFPDGQLYAVLPRGSAGAPAAAAALGALLTALGHRPQSLPRAAAERAALFRRTVSGRRLLVVVEDVTDDEQIRLLEPRTPGARLLVTSRLRPCAVRTGNVYELDRLGLSEGVALLAKAVGAERVRAEPSEALALVELCEGLPLALSVVASRLASRPHLTLGGITTRLRAEDQRLAVLTHNDAGVLPLQQQLYESLPPSAARLFVRLGLLGTADFAPWVAEPLLDLDHGVAGDALETLVDARLVDIVPHTGPSARYRLDGLAAVHARHLLTTQESGAERSAARARVHDAWLCLADEACRRLDGEHDLPLGTAFRRRLPGPEVDLALTDPRAWYALERANLLAAVRQPYRAGDSESCWHLALLTGLLAEEQAQFEDWRAVSTHAQAVARQARDGLGEAAMLCSLARLDLHEGEFARARTELVLALEVFDQLGQPRWAALATRLLGRLAAEESGDATPTAHATPTADRPHDAGPTLTRVSILGQRLTGTARTLADCPRGSRHPPNQPAAGTAGNDAGRVPVTPFVPAPRRASG